MIRVFVLLILINLGCSTPKETKSSFVVNEMIEGIELSENGRPVFFYQRLPKASTGNNLFNNYLHPLYDLNGDTLTEEFPEDHPYHRGIFWAWHQLYIQNKSVGDGWIMEDIAQDVVDVKTTVDKEKAQLSARVLWRSRLYENEKPFLEEHASIIVHQSEQDIRKIDFEISLKSFVPGVQLGGSDDVKGYGGFCVRIKLPNSLTFTSTNGSVAPQEGQVVAGAWMDFSHYDSARREESGLAILCHPSTPNYPAPWILRQSGSMQNIVFPGSTRIELPMDKPIVLRYRLIIHNGSAGQVEVASLQSEYEQQVFN